MLSHVRPAVLFVSVLLASAAVLAAPAGVRGLRQRDASARPDAVPERAAKQPAWTSEYLIRTPSLPSDPHVPAAQPLGDTDGDTVDDAIDNCLTLPNTDQADDDEDGVGNVCDNCPATPNPRPSLLSEDFEGDSEGWTHAPLGGADTWHLNTFGACEEFLGSRMYASNGNALPPPSPDDDCTGDSSFERSRLLGPPVDLPATTGSITLSFDALAWDEGGSCLASGDYDARDVGLSTNGGLIWTTLNDCFPLTTSEGVPAHHNLDLSAFAGQEVQVVFVYDTIDEIGGDTFAVDNLIITSNGVPQIDSDGDGLGDACDACPEDFDNDSDDDGVCGDVDNCPSHPNAPPPPLDENFTSGGIGWTHGPIGPGVDTWHPSEMTCFGDDLGSPMYVSNGNYGPGCSENSSRETSRLLSPPYVMPTAGVTIEFEAVSFDEQGSCLASREFDAKDVGLTTDGGQSYTLLNDCFQLTEVKGETVDHAFAVQAVPGFEFQLVFAYDTVDHRLDHTFAIDDVIFSPHQDDLDADGIGNPCDSCPADPFNDGDDDGWCAPVDNCPTVYNPLQENQDGDARGDVCDCRMNDPSAFEVPGDVGGLLLQNRFTLAWDSQTESAGPGTTYQVMRGVLDQWPVGSGPSETCVHPNVILPTAQDFTPPAVGSGLYYLVRGTNNCGAGTYGYESSMDQRVTAVCP